MATPTAAEDPRRSEFVDPNLHGARFVRVDLSGAVMRAVDISGADIDAPWLLEARTLCSSTVSTWPRSSMQS